MKFFDFKDAPPIKKPLHLFILTNCFIFFELTDQPYRRDKENLKSFFK